MRIILSAVTLLIVLNVPLFGQVDFSGEWFHLWYEDPQEYGSGPNIGDYTGMPVNDAALVARLTLAAVIYNAVLAPFAIGLIWRLRAFVRDAPDPT